MIYSVLVTVQVLVAFSLIGLILLQHGKGADAGAAFGSGASGTVFGAKGSANFMSRATAVLAAVFIALSLTLAYLVGVGRGTSGESVTSELPVKTSSAISQPASDTKRKQASDLVTKPNGGMNTNDTGAMSTSNESSGSPAQSSGKIVPLPEGGAGNSSSGNGNKEAGSESNTGSGNSS